MANFVDKKLREIARGQPCMIRVRGICTGGGEDSVWCHSNSQRHGKGMGIKAHDCYGAIGCFACHSYIDNDKDGSREEKQWAFLQGFERTILYLWTQGLVKVA